MAKLVKLHFVKNQMAVGSGAASSAVVPENGKRKKGAKLVHP